MNTVPNQKIIHINKSKVNDDFMQIRNEDWIAAYKDLKPSSFAIFLYLAKNADGYDMALSQKAIENALDIKKATYHKAIAELEEKGYLHRRQGNIWDFNLSPKIDTKLKVSKNRLEENRQEVSKNILPSLQKETKESPKVDLEVSKSNIEIDNTYKKDNKDKKDKEAENMARIEEALAAMEAEEVKVEVQNPFTAREEKNIEQLERDVDPLELEKATTWEEAAIALGFFQPDYFAPCR